MKVWFNTLNFTWFQLSENLVKSADIPSNFLRLFVSNPIPNSCSNDSPASVSWIKCKTSISDAVGWPEYRRDSNSVMVNLTPLVEKTFRL